MVAGKKTDTTRNVLRSGVKCWNILASLRVKKLIISTRLLGAIWFVLYAVVDESWSDKYHTNE